MVWLLDTNTVSELRKVQSGRANPNVAAWQADIPKTDMFLSAVTIMELEMGILQIERKDTTQGTLLRRWMNEAVMPTFAHRILAFDTTTALQCAALHTPDPRSWRDSVIAATALTHRMTIVTRNIKDFQSTGAALLNPWQK